MPSTYLGLPILIEITKYDNSGIVGGSGFIFRHNGGEYLITAKHVLQSLQTGKPYGKLLRLLAYPSDSTDLGKRLFTIDLDELRSNGDVKAHPTADIIAVKIGDFESTITTPPGVSNMQSSKDEPTRKVIPVVGVLMESTAHSSLGVVSDANLRMFSDVLIGNDTIMFGYPTSLNLVNEDHIDFSRPLLRKGIIAGEDPAQKFIIVDSPSYQGDSGGPVIEVDNQSFSRQFRIIGIVHSFIPFADTWQNTHFAGLINTTYQNSGYTIVVPLDYALEAINQALPSPGPENATSAGLANPTLPILPPPSPFSRGPTTNPPLVKSPFPGH